MKNIYYTDLFVITDDHRKDKYEKLLIASLKNDLSNWQEFLDSEGEIYYVSPWYGDSKFLISKYGSLDIAYVKHKKSVVYNADVKSELISNNFTGEFY